MVNHPNRSKTATNPDHRCSLGYTITCSCGWHSETFFEGPGAHARKTVLAQWRRHREECEKRAGAEQ